MVTGFDILGHDRKLRKHWLYRVLAIMIDMLIVFFATGAVLMMMDKNTIIISGLVSSVVLFLYSGIMEAAMGATIGKKILGLKARYLGTGGSGSIMLFLRNIPKVLWYILLPIDAVIGLAGRGDPRQRLFDRITKTTVVHAGESDHHHPVITNDDDGAIQEDGEVGQTAPSPIFDEPASTKNAPLEVAPTKDLEEKCRSCGGELVSASGDKAKCLGCGQIQ